MNILYGITTYGSAPYVDLQIAYLSRFNIPLVVLDSKSDPLVLGVCDRYKVKLLSYNQSHIAESNKAKHLWGDLMLFNNLLKYAKGQQCDMLIKASRRWLCMLNPVPSILQLAQQTDGSTYSNGSKAYNIGFRSLFMALRMKLWSFSIPRIDLFLKTNYTNEKPGDFDVLHLLHVLARRNLPTSLLYMEYKKIHPTQEDWSGYVKWQWMGDDRINPPPYILWHDKHTASDYYNKAKQFGLKYTLDDFKIE